jgi:hypothetical protein
LQFHNNPPFLPLQDTSWYSETIVDVIDCQYDESIKLIPCRGALTSALLEVLCAEENTYKGKWYYEI